MDLQVSIATRGRRAGDAHPLTDFHQVTGEAAPALSADCIALEFPDGLGTVLVRRRQPQKNVRICPGNVNDFTLKFERHRPVELGHGVVSPKRHRQAERCDPHCQSEDIGIPHSHSPLQDIYAAARLHCAIRPHRVVFFHDVLPFNWPPGRSDSSRTRGPSRGPRPACLPPVQVRSYSCPGPGGRSCRLRRRAVRSW